MIAPRRVPIDEPIVVRVDGGTFAGTPAEVVAAMRDESFFPDAGTLAEYARWVGDRVAIRVAADDDAGAAAELIAGMVDHELAIVSKSS